MVRYIGARLGTALISILGIALVVFLITQLLPGDAARVQAGQYATEEQIEALRVRFGLDRPIYVQLGDYLWHLVRFDLGDSTRTGQSVLGELLQRLPATLELSLLALVIALLIGVVLGTLAASNRGRIGDGIIRVYTVLSSSTATFWIALLAIYLFANVLGWFPNPTGRLPRGIDDPDHITGMYVLDGLLTGNLESAWGALRTLMLPALLLGIVTSPSILKVVRSSTIRALDSDYTRTARMFGYSRGSILFRDGLRNSLLPVVTTVGIVVGYLLGGNIIIEQLFSWPGIGQYAFLAVQAHDLSALRGFAVLVGVIYVLINTILDFVYVLIDPRVQAQAVSR